MAKAKQGFRMGDFKADYLEVKGHVFTREGRTIYRDDKPFVYVERVGDTRPVEADEAAQLFEYLLNGVAQLS